MNPARGTLLITAATAAVLLDSFVTPGFAADGPGAPPPADVFGRLPAIQFAAISPDGHWLARDMDRGGNRVIVILETGTGKMRNVIGMDPENKLRGLEWADDSTLLIDGSVQQSMPCRKGALRCNYEWLRTFAAGRDGGAPRLLLMIGSRQYVTGSRMLAAHTARPGSVTMETLDFKPSTAASPTESRAARVNKNNSTFVSVVFDVDTATGRGTTMAVGTASTEDWLVDERGDPIARVDEFDDDRRVLYARGNGTWHEVYRQVKPGHFAVMGLTLDGGAVVVVGQLDGDREKAWAIGLDGSGAKLVFEAPDRDLDVAYVDGYTHAVQGVATAGPNPVEQWFDPRARSRHRVIMNAYPGQKVDIIGESADGQKVLVAAEKPSRPPVFSLVDLDRSRAEVIESTYPELANAPLGTVSSIDYGARDGTRIPAFLTLPPGREVHKLPLVVLPHGGPEAHDDDHFDWLVQFLATRGYAVLQPQFRGSTGYGEAHRRAGYRQWGALMQDDVTDGVRHLISQGTVDPAQVCIVGASYGGYAALAGAAFTPELYACAVSINGVSDLPQMIDAERRRGGNSSAFSYWMEHIGPPSDPNIAAKSPARSAGTFKAPVLLMHGSDDSTVPFQQSEMMSKALQKAGKPVTFVPLGAEDHWLSRPETRIRVLQELERFLAQYLH